MSDEIINAEYTDIKDKPIEVKENKIKFGLGIGTISNNKITFDWMLNQMALQKGLPSGIHWSYVYAIADFNKVKGANYATSRTEVVKAAKAMGLKWLMFIDTDVFLPVDGIQKLMSHEEKIVTGIYWMKRVEVPQPIIYREVGDGPIWKVKRQDELLEIGGAGLGCTLIHMDVFDDFDKAGIEYFKQDWDGKNFQGKEMKVHLGEDHWFFTKARELGHKVYCDTNVVCTHYDDITEQHYPSKDYLMKYIENK